MSSRPESLEIMSILGDNLWLFMYIVSRKLHTRQTLLTGLLQTTAEFNTAI